MTFDAEIQALLVAAVSIGCLHTAMGPDHYVPFLALAKARGWSLRRTLAVTAACGTGHVIGSIVLGAIGIALGLALGGLTRVEALRVDLAAWALIALGLGYAAWGLKQRHRAHRHAHLHVHADGTVHHHPHDHRGGHAHVHADEARSVTPWLVFLVFVLGPCEALIPLLMYPASQHDGAAVAAVTGVFVVATIGTMLAAVALGYRGLQALPGARLAAWRHSLSGLAVAACGAMALAV